MIVSVFLSVLFFASGYILGKYNAEKEYKSIYHRMYGKTNGLLEPVKRS